MITVSLDQELHDFLKSIYDSKYDFEVRVSDRKTSRRLGTYFKLKRKIVLYPKLIKRSKNDLKAIAIHEYAHHLHFTEFQSPEDKDPHGPHFWRIYSALMSKATMMGIYSDPYIATIFKD